MTGSGNYRMLGVSSQMSPVPGHTVAPADTAPVSPVPAVLEEPWEVGDAAGFAAMTGALAVDISHGPGHVGVVVNATQDGPSRFPKAAVVVVVESTAAEEGVNGDVKSPGWHTDPDSSIREAARPGLLGP
jgi:hypothetical protein